MYSPPYNQVGDRAEIVAHQGDVGGLHRHVSAGADRDAVFARAQDGIFGQRELQRQLRSGFGQVDLDARVARDQMPIGMQRGERRHDVLRG